MIVVEVVGLKRIPLLSKEGWLRPLIKMLRSLLNGRRRGGKKNLIPAPCPHITPLIRLEMGRPIQLDNDGTFRTIRVHDVFGTRDTELLTTPSAPFKEREHFLDGAATPPLKGGEFARLEFL